MSTHGVHPGLPPVASLWPQEQQTQFHPSFQQPVTTVEQSAPGYRCPGNPFGHRTPSESDSNHRIDDIGAAQVLTSFQSHSSQDDADGRQSSGTAAQTGPYSGTVLPSDRNLPATLKPLLELPISNQRSSLATPSKRLAAGQPAPYPDRPILPNPAMFTPQTQSQPREHHGPQSAHRSPPSARPSLVAPVGARSPASNRSDTNPLPTPKAESPPKEFKTAFQFVINGTGKEARKTVRKHVMKEFRRKERWEQSTGKRPKKEDQNDDHPNKKRKTEEKDTSPSVSGESTLAGQATSATSPSNTDPGSETAFRQGHGFSSQHQSNSPTSPSSNDAFDQAVASASYPAGFEFDEDLQNRLFATSVDGRSPRILPTFYSPKRQATIVQRIGVGSNTKRSGSGPIQPLIVNVPPDIIDNLETEPDTEIIELNNKSAPINPYSEVGRAMVDPFGPFNFDRTPSTQKLLNHFCWVMPSMMDQQVASTTFRRVGWLYSAVSRFDPTPEHVILGFTLAHMAQCRGVPEPQLAIQHKDQAYVTIRQRLSNPATSASDESIGSVVNLAGWELVDCNAEKFYMHMNGIFQIICSRGGLASLARNPPLENIVIRLDILRAYITISAPRYPNYALIRSLEPIAINIPPRMDDRPCASSYTIVDHRRSVYKFAEECLLLVHGLEDLVLLIRSTAQENPNIPDHSKRELLTSSILQLLSSRAHSDDSSPLPTPDSANFPSNDRAQADVLLHLRKKCLALAAFLFLDACFRYLFDEPWREASYFGERLKQRFMAEWRPEWARSLEMFCVVLLGSDRMSLEKPWRAWYVADVVTLALDRPEGVWRSAEQMLVGFLENEEWDDMSGTRSEVVWDANYVASYLLRDWR